MEIPPLNPIWDSLVRTIAAMITLAPEYVVVQVHGDDGPDGGPYVQTLREEDGCMTLEAASNQFLDNPLDEGAIANLLSSGWNEPELDNGMPNYHRLVGPELAPVDIAKLLTHTLIDVYKITSSAAFEMAPLQLFVELLNGEFGEPTGMNFVRDDSDPRDVGI
jgi:hypothetical protein